MRDYKQEICSYLDRVWDEACAERRNLFKKLRSSKHVCLFGAGQVGQAVAYDLVEAQIKIDFFCDNNRQLWGQKLYQDICCISLKELDLFKEDVFILVTTGSFQEICSQLMLLGFKNVFVMPQLMIRDNKYWENTVCASVKKNICQLIDLLEDERSREVVEVVVRNWFGKRDDRYAFSSIAENDQYFPEEIIKLSNTEVFVDVGAFTGDTLAIFLDRTKNLFARIIAYELNKNCYQKLMDSVQAMDAHVREKIKVYNLGLYDTNSSVGYTANTTSSSINLDADAQGKVVRLADHQPAEKITFIKMDIEGAEIKAMKGAEEIIKACAPKLAICVYHVPSHLWEIPFLIKSLVPDYKIYLRHHTALEYETVCYAAK